MKANDARQDSSWFVEWVERSGKLSFASPFTDRRHGDYSPRHRARTVTHVPGRLLAFAPIAGSISLEQNNGFASLHP
jgi:hypothetical protein